MTILGRRKNGKVPTREVRVSAAVTGDDFAAALNGIGYKMRPALLPASDVRKLLGSIPNSLENMVIAGEQGYYRTREVEPLWRKT